MECEPLQNNGLFLYGNVGVEFFGAADSRFKVDKFYL